jgi:hypothetical protein
VREAGPLFEYAVESLHYGVASRYANEKALILAGLGDKERTFEALDDMASVGPQRIGHLPQYSGVGVAKDDPRLKAFRKKVGLPD